MGVSVWSTANYFTEKMLLKGNLLIAAFVCAIACNAQTYLPDVNFGEILVVNWGQEIALSVYYSKADILEVITVIRMMKSPLP